MTADRRTTVDDGELERRLRLTYRTVMPLLDVEPTTSIPDDGDGAPGLTIDVVLRRPPRSRAKLVAIAAIAVVVVGVAVAVAFHALRGTPVTPMIEPLPGSGRIAYTRVIDDSFSDARIVVADSDGANPREVTHTFSGPFDKEPRLSPDGTKIVFYREFSPNGDTAIRTVGSDGTDEHWVDLGCKDPCVRDTIPTWAADGKHIVFQRIIGPIDPTTKAAASAVLWQADLNGENVERLSEPGIDGAFADSGASFAPGGYIVFSRNRTADGLNAVFRMNRDGTDVRQLSAWLPESPDAQVSPAKSGLTRDLVVFTYVAAYHNPERHLSLIATVPATCRSDADCAARTRLLTTPTSTESTDTHQIAPVWSPDGRRIAFTVLTQPTIPVGIEGLKAGIWTMDWDGQDLRLVADTPLVEFGPTWGATPAGQR